MASLEDRSISAEEFSVPFETHSLKGDCFSTRDSRPNILVLHGAGHAERSRYRPIREFLLRHNFGSCAFDMIGHGETGGDLSNSSLTSRTSQALEVIKDRRLQEPLTLIGASMGAYTALKILQNCKVSRLILLVPGMYGKSAYHIPFGPNFSKEIRKVGNWRSSDAWDLLSVYTGKT